MPSLFRYLSEKNSQAFVERGEVLFRSLSYFRDYEDAGVRADEHEGTLVHRPIDGLILNNTTTGALIPTPYRFESTAREDDIFVYCLSTELSADIGQRFNADVAVEISEPFKFLSRLRNSLALRRRFRTDQLVYEEVHYYDWHEPPIVDWALPEKISMRKPKSFEWQKEYRFALPLGNAFDVENVSVNLVHAEAKRMQRSVLHPQLLLKLGSLAKLCRVHRF